MAGTVKIGPQDLPPEGGYSPIQTERIKLRTIVGGRLGICIFYGMSAVGLYCYYLNLKNIRRDEIEMRSSQLAVLPLLEAERDRALLKYMRRLRDEEAEVMKNVPGWEVGTFYGKPLFNVERSEFFEPRFADIAVFSDPKSYEKRLNRNIYG